MKKTVSVVVISALCLSLTACHSAAAGNEATSAQKGAFQAGQCLAMNALNNQLSYPVSGESLNTSNAVTQISQLVNAGFAHASLNGKDVDTDSYQFDQVCGAQTHLQASASESSDLIKAGVCTYYQYTQSLLKQTNAKGLVTYAPSINMLVQMEEELDLGKFQMDLTQCPMYLSKADALGLDPKAIIYQAKNNNILTKKPQDSNNIHEL